MRKRFLEIWKKAEPYYKKARINDIPQIKWMVKKAERIANPGLNLDILIPLIILHDVGYSTINQNNPNVQDKKIKIKHMREGAKIAEKILKDLNYDENLSKTILNHISVHDNWLINDSTPFKKNKEMALFNDLDFLAGIKDKKSFLLRAKSMKQKPEEMYQNLLHDEKLTERPFCCKQTKDLFRKIMEARKKELKIH